MSDLKKIIANNIKLLRTKDGLTQADFAARINYSDKSVSKWERGDGIPDIIVLKQIADMYSVSIEWMITEHETASEEPAQEKIMNQSQRIIVALAIIGAFFLALLAFFIGWIGHRNFWSIFIYWIPVSFAILIIFNSIWGRFKITFYYTSGLIWTTLLSVYIATLSNNLWLVFIIGIPLQLAAALAFRIKPGK